MKKVIDIEGIGKVSADKLSEAGVVTTDDLLKVGATPQARQAFADKTGLSVKLVAKWVSQADLFRVKGIGEEYAELVLAAGVESVQALAQQDAAALHAKMVALNKEKDLVRQAPGASQVAGWVEFAKTLPALIS